ncbi:hypothetical protein OVA24_09245 [Luteolibacter sp. SL250]|uniref:hypothetical protein n=1 Tax=Luteolibacter sp. SL250 TaxID=2995170 RepID=UPI002270D125|nr:hypothetical protein [Luteolibacter sp. SL250]WAC21568.1 hypothetical protein OVA24_09245 [Luteolibacter sp. SL250]
MYKQSIIFFGIVLPVLGLLALVGACFYIKSEMSDSFAVKMSQFRAYSQGRQAAMQTESKIKSQREHLERWKKELAVETTSTVRTHLKTITDQISSKEFQETGFDPLTTRSGFAAVTQQKSSQFRMGFRGTFRSAQRAMLELEARMPQLTLQELKATPSDQSTLLNFQVSYTAWEH